MESLAVPAMDDVPLVGRDAELAAASAALAGGGCVISGVAGVGKSRLAAEVALRSEGPVERVLATASAGTLPFGAFSQLLADLQSIPGIPAAIRTIRERFPDERPTLVVDDAHLLDDASAALVLGLASTRTAQLLLTVRSHESAPDAVTSLWKELRLDRIELQPLSRAEVRTLVDAQLGSASHASVHAKVYERTQGNPLFVTELIQDSVHSGALAIEDGRWHWTGKHPIMERLQDLIAARTRALSDAARHALEVLAVAAPIDLDIFEPLVGPEAIEELERTGSAHTTERFGTSTVELAHPLYGEVIRARLPVSVARRLRRQLARAIEGRGEMSTDQMVRVASWKLEAGEVDHDLFVAASTAALKATAGVPGSGWGPGDPSLAIQLADAAGPSLAAALCASAARLAMNRADEVEELLAPYEQEASHAPIETAIAYVRARNLALDRSGTGASAAIDLLARTQGWHDTDDWATFWATAKGWTLLSSGALVRCRRLLEPLLDVTGVDPQLRLDLLIALGIALARLGLTDRCEALEDEVKDLCRRLQAGGWETGWAEFMVDVMGRTEAARDVEGVGARLEQARMAAQTRGDEALAAAMAYAEGRLALDRGHPEDAIRLLTDAADGLTFGDPRNALGLAFTYLARAYALRGDLPAAEAALERAGVLARERPNVLRLSLELDRSAAWAQAACGRWTAAAERLLEVADKAADNFVLRASAIHEALRLGADPHACARALTTIAESAENELLDAFAGHARAHASGDPEAQLDAASRFAELGVDLLAAEAAAGASRGFADQGRGSSSRRAAALSSTLASRCQGARTPALQLRTEVVSLTPREREVVEMVARGLTNADIAAQLVLSVRSIETYLLRACRKLGVKSRHDLRDLVAPPDA